MQRKQDGLIPIGEALADLDGPVKAIRDATPQALHHFTQADQVNQLVSQPAKRTPIRGFMARMLALCSLPRTNPGNRIRYKRVNGPYTLYMTAGGGNKLPFGNIPPPLAGLGLDRSGTDPKSRVLILGDSLSEFMRELGSTTAAAGGAFKPASATR